MYPIHLLARNWTKWQPGTITVSWLSMLDCADVLDGSRRIFINVVATILGRPLMKPWFDGIQLFELPMICVKWCSPLFGRLSSSADYIGL
jgi:hypothetical protein